MLLHQLLIAKGAGNIAVIDLPVPKRTSHM